jgi:hypothetical protein
VNFRRARSIEGLKKYGRTANASTSEVGWSGQGWELLGCDFALADGPFPTGVGIFEDVERVTHVIVVFVAIAFHNRRGESSGHEEKGCEGDEMHCV